MSSAVSQALDVHWFRQASPYINAYRGATIVLHFSAESLRRQQGTDLIHDIALLSHLGAKLVLVFGAREAIDTALSQQGLQSQFHQDMRITDEHSLPHVLATIGSLRLQLEAALTTGLANTPMSGSRLTVCSGNFVIAKPYGVRDGVDYHHTGEVRKVDQHAVTRELSNGHIVLVSPLGYSRTGELFNVRSEEIATEVAASLNAEKLIFLMETSCPSDAKGQLIKQLTPQEAQTLQQSADVEKAHSEHLGWSTTALKRGVKRVHLLDRTLNGALLLELFTRDGCGTMIAGDNYETLRQARIDDISGLMQLIAPLEQDGTLVHRPREQLELDIEHFSLIERDGMAIACAALFLHEDGMAEFACVATHPEYRGGGRAEKLLQHIEQRALRVGVKELFVLTTQTAHWFLERGFKERKLDDLPMEKRQLYNYRRRSKVFFKRLVQQ